MIPIPTIIGYDFYGIQFFENCTSPVYSIYRVELKNGIYDELHIRERTNVSCDNTKIGWQLDTRLLAKFLGNLEAGNISNEGLQITQFVIKRRKIDELNNITLGYLPFENNTTVEYIDNTQANLEYIYSIIPVGENDLEGKPNEVQIKSDFVGWWICAKDDTNNTIACDKYIGDSETEVNIQLNERRVLLETLNKYPQIYRLPIQYHTFSLTAVLIPEENETSYEKYQKIINMINSNKPFVAKSGSGDLYIVEISNPRKLSPQNTYKGRDYISVTLDLTEIMSESEYHQTY